MPFTHLFVARKLKFYQLVVLDQALQSGSLLHAARTLGLTQPAVTKIIHELESYFGAPLLIRSSKGVSATALGDMLARRGRSLLSELSLLIDDVNAFQNGTSGHICVGTLLPVSDSLLPRAIHLLQRRAPDVRISIRLGPSNQLFPALSMGRLDLVVGSLPDDWQSSHDFTRLKAKALYSEELAIVCGAHHPLTERETVNLVALRSYPWILPTRDSLLRTTLENLFHEAGLSAPANAIESLSLLTNIGLMQDQHTITVMPKKTAQLLSQGGLLTTLVIGTRLKFGDVGYIQARIRDLRPAATLLRECLELVAAEERQVI